MLITGAKGFAIQLLDVCLQINPDWPLYFFDDINKNTPDYIFDIYPVFKNLVEVEKHISEVNPSFSLGIGKPALRRLLFGKFTGIGGKPITVISPAATIGRHRVKLGDGCCVLTNSVIESTSVIGTGTLINLGVMITHGCEIGDFCELGPGVQLLGNVTVENDVFIGTGAIVLPGINIGKEAIIGAGAMVNRDVMPGTTVGGVPAKLLKK